MNCCFLLIPLDVALVVLKFDLGRGGSLAEGRGRGTGGDDGRSVAASASLFAVRGSCASGALAEVTLSIMD